MKTENKNKLSNYKKQFAIIREELNKVDPLGVINDNLIDEYDLENQYILAKLKYVQSPIQLAEIIAQIFKKTCNIKTTKEEWIDCAKNILNKINNLL